MSTRVSLAPSPLIAPDAITRVANGWRVSTMRPLLSQPMSLTRAVTPVPSAETIRPIWGPVGVSTYCSSVTLPDQSSTPQSSPSGAILKPVSVLVPQALSPP